MINYTTNLTILLDEVEVKSYLDNIEDDELEEMDSTEAEDMLLDEACVDTGDTFPDECKILKSNGKTEDFDIWFDKYVEDRK